jgi:hypothetical protein
MTYNPVDIFISKDLKDQTVSKVINRDIIIRGQYLKKIEGVEKIFGSLGISDSTLESLGDLNEITGDFWTSFYTVQSPLKSLNSLEKIGGDASFRYSNLEDLGRLKSVGGKLSLRDTSITNLGNLQFVGGDLYLPKRLKDSINLSNINVGGKIQFWNDSKNKSKITDKVTLGLIESKVEIPYWEHKYIFSVNDLTSANAEQVKFYHFYKDSFNKGIFLNINGNDNYAFVLFYDLLSEYYHHRDIEKLESQYSNIEKYYPKTSNYTSLSIIEEFRKNADFINAWRFTCKREFVSVQTIWEYERKLNKKLINGKFITKLGGFSHLTDFGQNNILLIEPFAEEYLSQYEKEYDTNFFDLFCDNDIAFKSVNNIYSDQYYKRFYISEAEFNHYKSIDDSQESMRNPNFMTHVVEKAILNQFRFILKKAEDLYRAKIGMPKIGEGWISETELFYKITDFFKEHEVINHARPSWLGRQHLDIYFPKLNIGIEYQGLQHYEPVEFFGGKDAFERNVERDEIKRRICKENDCILIYVNEKYNFELVVLDIEQKIQAIQGRIK